MRKIFLTLTVCFFVMSVLAQKTYKVSGVVLDSVSKKPLAGVYITDGKTGAQTNKNGFYSIRNIKRGKTVLRTMYYSVFSSKIKEVNITGDTIIDFSISEQLTQLDNVVVTGTRTAKRLSDVPVLTTLIQSGELRKGADVSFLESLQFNIPGLVSSSNAMGNNLRIKGLTSRYILFLVDGERLVSEGAGGNINLDQIDVNNIKRIEVVNGAASALYGSNAVGAVINIITKEPVHNFEAGANVIAESNNTYTTRASFGSNLKKFSARASGFRKSSDGFDKGGSNFAKEYKDWGSNLKLKYKPMERLFFDVTGRFFRHETFNPPEAQNAAHPLTYNFSTGGSANYLSKDKRNNMKLSVNFDKYFDYDILEAKKDKKDKQNTCSYLSSRFVNTFKYSDRLEVVGGFEENHEETYAVKTLGLVPQDKSIDDMNVFGQAEYGILNNLDVVAGARYTYNTEFESAFTPKIALKYKLGNFNFRGGVGTSYRAPSIKELHYDFDHSGMFQIKGNPDLKAEKGLYNSLSVEYNKGPFSASVSGYYNDIDDKITLYDIYLANNEHEKHYRNVSSATLKGFDVSVSYLFFRQLSLKGNYSYCDAKDNSTGLQLEDNVKHSGTVSATWNGTIMNSPFSLRFAGRMNSPILYQEESTDKDGNVVVSKKESKDYSVWKAVFVKPFRFYKHTLELTLKCNNIFDFKDSNFTDPGRTYMAGLRYSFK